MEAYNHNKYVNIMKINDYKFEEVFSEDELFSKSGIYVIICKGKPIDVGESHDVKERIKNHGREDCWIRHCKNYRKFVHYTPHKQKHGRMIIEQQIRDNYDLPCGVV